MKKLRHFQLFESWKMNESDEASVIDVFVKKVVELFNKQKVKTKWSDAAMLSIEDIRESDMDEAPSSFESSPQSPGAKFGLSQDYIYAADLGEVEATDSGYVITLWFKVSDKKSILKIV